MSVIKLSKKDITTNNSLVNLDEEDKRVKINRNQMTFDSAMVSGWETTNKSSLETINNYQTKINNGEYLTAEDIASYRTALDGYIDSSNRLRGINKRFGSGYTDKEEKEWTDNITSWNTAFDETSKYYSQFKTEKDYNDAVAYQERQEGLKSFDLNAGKAELDELQTKVDNAKDLDLKIRSAKSAMKYDSRIEQQYNSLMAQWKELYGDETYSDIQENLASKNAYYMEAERLQTSTTMQDTAKNAEDFDKYSKLGVEKGLDTEFKWATTEHGNLELFSNVRNDMIITYREDPDLVYEKSNIVNGGIYAAEALKYAQHMTDDEYNTYIYYYGKDEALADKYLKSIEETINARQAGQIIDNIGDDVVLEGLFATAAGVDQFFTGMENLFTDKDYYAPTSMQIASGEIRKDWIEDAGFIGQAGYDLLNTTGNMLPSILVSYVPVVGQVAGTASMGLSAAGNAKAEMINLGYSKEQALAYGALVGVSEAGLQYLLGGISKLGGKASQGLTSKILTKVDNAFARTAIKLGGSMFSEYFEESLQTILEPWFKHITTGVDFEAPNIGEVLYSGLLGALSAGVLEGAGTVAGEVNTYKTGKQIQNVGAVERLTKLGTTFSADSVAHQLAGKVNENTGAYTIGRLFNEVGATLTEANKADIVKSLEEKGMSTKDANTIAKWLGKAVEGEYFSKRQIAVLENNDVVSKTFADVIVNQNSTVNQRMKGYTEVNYLVKNGGSTAMAGVDAVLASESSPQGTKDSQTNVSPIEEETPSTAEILSHFDGKSRLIEDNSEVDVKEIDSMKDGVVSVRLDDGRVVDKNDVHFGTKEEGLVFEAVTTLGVDVDTANSIVQMAREKVKGINPNGSIEVGTFIEGLRNSYLYGNKGLSATELAISDKTNFLPEELSKQVYNQGKIKAVMESKKAQDAIKETAAKVKEAQKEVKKANKEGSEQPTEKTGRVKYHNIDESTLTKRQSISVKALERIAKVFTHSEFTMFASYKNAQGKRVYKDENGVIKSAPSGMFYADGRIWIDINAGNMGNGLILFTAAHELTHFAKQFSPEQYKLFTDFLMDQYGKLTVNGKKVSVDLLVAKQIKKAKDRGRTITYDEAFDEVVADSCERFLLDGNALKKLDASEKIDKGVIAKIKSFIRNLIKNIKRWYAGLNPDSLEANLISRLDKESYHKLISLWENMLSDAGETYSEIRNVLGKDSTIEVNENGEFLLGETKDGKILYNDRTWREGGRETLNEALEAEGYSEADIKATLAIIDAKHDLVERLGKEFSEQDKINKATITTDIKTGKSALSALVKNGDYPVNIDLLTVCKKRQAYQRVINRLCETGLIERATLDSLAIAEINKILGKYGFETACLGCFVESKRLLIQNLAHTVCEEWNSLVDKKIGKGKAKATKDINDIFLSELTDKEIDKLISEYAEVGNKANVGVGNYVKKFEKLMDTIPTLQRHLSLSDIVTPQGMANIKKISPELFSLIASRFGNATPKPVQDFNPYNSELALYGSVPKGYSSLRDYLYAIGGARMQSFSDFIVENWFDYCQIVADLAARKLPMHTYTKEIALVKLFGMTGIKINMSLIPDIDKSLGKEYAGLTRNANGDLELIWGDKDRFKSTGGKSYMQSINFADAVAIQSDPRYSANVGTIAVGVSDKHIRMMLDDARIRMIIPYHSSSINPIFAKLVGIEYYNDYTASQSTGVAHLIASKGNIVSDIKLSKAQKEKLTSGFEFNQVLQELGDAKDVAQAYLDWCADSSLHTIEINGERYNAVLTPKFEQFSDHENYYKLLEDFNTYDSITEQPAPQGDVQQVYPEAFESILRDELTAREKYRQKQEPKWESAMGEIETYLKKHTKADTVAYAKEQGIKLSDRDSDRNELSAAQIEYFKDSQVRDKDGNLMVVYHGSPSVFTEFSHKYMSQHGSQEGQGFYFTDKKSMAEGYKRDGGQLLAGYLDIKKPLSDSKVTLKRAEVTKLLKAIDPTGDDVIINYDPQGGLGYPSKAWYNRALQGTVDAIMRYSETDSEILADIANSGAGAKTVVSTIRELFGYDGYIVTDKYEGASVYVAFESNQFKNTDNKTPTSNPDIRYSDRGYAPTFYSQMGKVVEGMKQEKFGASSVVSMLRGRGVKAEEIRWSGIVTYLEGKKSVTKQELLEFIAGSQLQIGEQMSGNVTFVDTDGNFYESERAFNEAAYAKAESMGFDRDRVKFMESFDTDYYIAYVNTPASGTLLRAEIQEEGGTLGRWGDYKLKGGYNYREIVFTLPNSTYSNNMMKTHWGDEAEGILAHARIQDFEVNGKKMLFIEEIQSDLHNEGMQSGYFTDSDIAKVDELKAKADEAFFNLEDYSMKLTGSAGEWDAVKKTSEGVKLYRVFQQAKAEFRKADNELLGKIPDAPFKDNYHEYVLKRLLRMAAEEGYDSIGWTTADIQSKRWSEDYAEAYRIEYDQDMPKFLKKYGRQWGAKVEYAYLNKKETLDDISFDDIQSKSLEELKNGTKVWSMELTDSMKDSVLNEGQVLYSDRTSFASQVDAVLSGKDTTSTHLQVRKNTPKIFLEVGFEDKPMLITSVHVKTAVGQQLKKKNIHNINVETFKNLPKLLENPAMIMESTQKDHIVAFVNAVDNANNPIMCAIYIHGRGYYNSIDVDTNLIKSVYGKDTNPIGFIERAVEEDRVLYWDKKMSQDLFEIPKLQLPDNLNSLDSNTIIRKAKAFVNQKAENSDIKFQDRDSDSLSNRNLLANALESATKNDIEKNKLAQYKQKIDLINAEEQKLHDLREQIKEISFSKGKRDVEKLRNLQFEAKQAANRINTYDRQLLTLEASKPLKDVLDREKQLAYKKAEQKGKEALAKQREKQAETTRELMNRYQESRAKGVEGRRKTKLRGDIRRTVAEIRNILMHGNKKRNVKEDMQDFASQALRSAEILFTDEYSREDMIRNGIVTDLTPEESKVVDECVSIVAQMDAYAEEGNTVALEQTKAKLANRMQKIPDVFVRERNRLNKVTVKTVLNDLARAYKSLESSDEEYIQEAYMEGAYQYLLSLEGRVGGSIVKDMTLEQLETMKDAYTIVLNTIRNANKLFAEDIKQTRAELGNKTIEEFVAQKKDRTLSTKGQDKRDSYTWNNEKPIYAFERLGSNTLKNLFGNVLKGEDAWAVDVSEASDFAAKMKEKYGYNSWDFDKLYKFKSSTGIEFELNLEQIMSLYAYAQREAAYEHLRKGGFVFQKNTEVKIKKNGIKRTYLKKTATAHNLSFDALSEILNTLNDKQKGFVVDMQRYLSDTMGAKGNEVSMKLYGVKLFKEKRYFPLKSAGQYLEKAKEADAKAEQGKVRVVNAGFTNATVPNASNPIILDNFMDVWASHVNEMSMYHALTIPLEDFRKIYNYKTPTAENLETMSVNSVIQNKHGDAAIRYIDQLYDDINGGTRSDPREGVAKNLISKFKKASTFLSLSVLIQQPTSVIRAMAYIDGKYFAGKPMGGKHGEVWAEVKKYAPVAIIKEMGYFDTNMGKSSVDYIKGNKYNTFGEKFKAFFKDSGYRDEKLSRLPALADELAWCSIWKAVKRETIAKHPELKVGSEAFMKAVGERFTEIVKKTQVYDSVLSRSANMRSKSVFMNMVTAFLAEPTTSINMVEDAIRKGMNGDKKFAAKALGSVFGSVLLNSALTSLVYAMRDDDEDETYLEKYMQSFTVEMFDGINPITYLPILKDIWSILQGFDVERADMSIITDVANSLEKIVTVIAKDTSDMDETELEEHHKNINDAWLGVVDHISSLLGVPVKNVRREINAVINTIKTATSGNTTSESSLGNAIKEALKDSTPIWGWFPDNESKTDKLYEAIMNGDDTYRKRLESGYKDQDAINSAYRTALRENDPRIKEAAQAVIDGNPAERIRITREIKAEGNFSQDIIVGAINAELTALRKKLKETK